MPASPRRVVLLTTWALVAACGDGAEPPPVLLDGAFPEWERSASVLDDPADAPDATLDIRSIRALDEGPWLYLDLDVGREVNAQSLPGTLHVLVDADADEATGQLHHGMGGVDIVLDLSQRKTPLVEGRGSGFALSALTRDSAVHGVTSHALHVMVAPTVSASRFELRLSRLGAPGFPALGGEIRLKGVYVEGDALVDETEVGRYAFRTAPSRPPPAATADRLAADADVLRVLQWNVASRSFESNAGSFARVIGALAPDVVLLDEAPPSVDPETVAAFFALAPLAELGAWHTVVGLTGGRQRTVVAARNRSLRPAQTMDEVHYPAGAFQGLGPDLPEAFRGFLSNERSRGLSATGAWVDIGGTEVLVVPVDLQSAGWAGSPQDRLREVQARTLRQRILEELDGGAHPVIVGGDLNLVGSARPLTALVEGLDVDGSDLVPANALRLGERTYATWRNPEGLFAPGRLDFLLIPDAVLEVVDAFVFTAEDLGLDALGSLGLSVDDSRVSDHLPVVADLRLRR